MTSSFPPFNPFNPSIRSSKPPYPTPFLSLSFLPQLYFISSLIFSLPASLLPSLLSFFLSFFLSFLPFFLSSYLSSFFLSTFYHFLIYLTCFMIHAYLGCLSNTTPRDETMPSQDSKNSTEPLMKIITIKT